MRKAKTLIRLGRCPGWSESSLGAQSLCWFCHVVAHFPTNSDRSCQNLSFVNGSGKIDYKKQNKTKQKNIFKLGRPAAWVLSINFKRPYMHVLTIGAIKINSCVTCRRCVLLDVHNFTPIFSIQIFCSCSGIAESLLSVAPCSGISSPATAGSGVITIWDIGVALPRPLSQIKQI